jgi:hypothetical protein
MPTVEIRRRVNFLRGESGSSNDNAVAAAAAAAWADADAADSGDCTICEGDEMAAAWASIMTHTAFVRCC